ARGTADPPHMTARIDERSRPGLARRNCRMSFQIVGTAAEIVTLSASIKPISGSACRNRSGMTRSAPDMNAAYGVPHAFAWNIGTIGIVRSSAPSPLLFAVHTDIECSQHERCE